MTHRIGLITDVHGNLEGLCAALAMLDDLGCDEILHLGDVVDIGPNSRECMDVLLSRKDVTCLLGNHDRDFVLNHAEARALSHVPTAHKKQVFASMSEQHRQAASKFPLSVERTCGGSKLLFCHYALVDAPFSWDVYPFMPLQTQPTAENLDEIFAHAEADAVFFGHKHEPCDIRGRLLYVDVGSVGCHPSPFARAAVIEYDNTHWSYRRLHTPYDVSRVRSKMKPMAAGDELFEFYYLHKHPNG